MSGDLLGQALREARIPLPPDGEERGLRVLDAAFAEREPALPGAPITRRPSLPRLALALGIASLLAALLLSPAGAAVRDWVDNAFTASAPPAEPNLARIPGGGRLLIQSAEGPWVVQPDGSRRLLGDYKSASWSPHGLFVVAARGRTLTALAPDGTPRWSITADQRVAFPGRLAAAPAWSPSGERIAYRSGLDLRVVAGDGTEDRVLAGSISAGHPPGVTASPAFSAAWSPTGENELAYVTGTGRVQILDSETGAVLAGAPALPRITSIDWGARGRKILEATPGNLRLRAVLPAGHPTRPALGAPRRLPLPPGVSVVDAALAPQRPFVAASITYWRKHGTHSEIVVFRPGGRTQTLLSVPGSLGQVVWSPDGRRILATWPGANQWVFLPLGRGRGRAIANISRAFSPGGQLGSSPLIDGWCCQR